MDFKDVVRDRYIGMENTLLESKLYGDYYGLSEGLIAKIKQARAEKKLEKLLLQNVKDLRKKKRKNNDNVKLHLENFGYETKIGVRFLTEPAEGINNEEDDE